jgi:hypothetical protein
LEGIELEQLHLTSLPGLPKDRYKNDYHVLFESVPGIVVFVGSKDMPTRKWKKILLNSCFSGTYYYKTFAQGTLFFSLALTYNRSAIKTFIEGIIKGDSDAGIRDSLNAQAGLNEYSDELYDFQSK